MDIETMKLIGWEGQVDQAAHLPAPYKTNSDKLAQIEDPVSWYNLLKYTVN